MDLYLMRTMVEVYESILEAEIFKHVVAKRIFLLGRWGSHRLWLWRNTIFLHPLGYDALIESDMIPRVIDVGVRGTIGSATDPLV